MKLYGNRTSPFASISIIIAHECGLADQLELIDLSISLTKPDPTITSLTGLGRIPVLVTNHDHPLFDSRVIVDYLIHHAGHKTLIPHDPVQRYRVLTLQALALGLAEVTVAYRYETFARPEALRWESYIDRTTLRIKAMLNDLNQHWRNDLDTVTVGSLTVACALRYLTLRIPDYNWQAEYPGLMPFYTQFLARPSFQATTP